MRLATLSIVVFLAIAPSAVADPCGMVPPISTGSANAGITRVGPQRTYVFFKDGLETYVIRPGFEGTVDDFGMLIPFPSVPSLRKVPDEIFMQVSAAIDPPEVVLDFSPIDVLQTSAAEAITMNVSTETPLRYEEVKVLKVEAVGMYEVAVLAAGSADALARWMREHGFRYPKGMDAVCNEYIRMGWVFVAEKTRVASKSASDPKPGMRAVDPARPKGTVFEGYVQAMGFRFRIDKPLLPMRLSPFNTGEKRQVVYFLADQPVRLDGVGTDRVVRQVSGAEIRRNVTEPLPLRVIHAPVTRIDDGRWTLSPALKIPSEDRNPAPVNGEARDLFASDLMAGESPSLALPHEEAEKELLRIGEALEMRGPEIDTLHEAELAAMRDRASQQALSKLDSLTMTVLDGEFPEAWLKAHDLTMSHYEMRAGANDAAHYDCNTGKPAEKREGVVFRGAFPP